ncbi:hypothetical protein GALMADRAFT_94990 [Galerina marginata CBS 339.88]|uniref:Uncharacterized protein n=1 Tax=Galerina marginata (strain CBS 339.88) TaxID=685588 RepID=A0A067T562_GALM3|nr:hypothetical protein GALMADRAFT_94990 [Galerina marginata CBS 339.88]
MTLLDFQAPNTRPIYLIAYESPLFRSHWALWIPVLESNEKMGKKIHVTGNPHVGFEHEFMRNYCIEDTTRKLNLIKLANVDSKYVVDVPGDGTLSTDTGAADEIEKIALTVTPPSKSLRSASSTPGKKVQIKDCQTWMREFVEALISEQVFPISALEILDTAPKN